MACVALRISRLSWHDRSILTGTTPLSNPATTGSKIMITLGSKYRLNNGKIVKIIKLHKTFVSLYNAVLVDTNTELVVAEESLIELQD
jgi:hypothetical protein